MSIVVVSLVVMGLLPVIGAYTLTSLPWVLLGTMVFLSAWMQHKGTKSAAASTATSA